MLVADVRLVDNHSTVPVGRVECPSDMVQLNTIPITTPNNLNLNTMRHHPITTRRPDMVQTRVISEDKEMLKCNHLRMSIMEERMASNLLLDLLPARLLSTTTFSDVVENVRKAPFDDIVYDHGYRQCW